MSHRKVKAQGKGSDVNGEGSENDDGHTTTAGELDASLINDDNPKVAGQANGKRMSDIAAKVK